MMTPTDIAYRAFPGNFTVKNGEIIPRYCPFCHGGEHKDRDTFALNIDTGLYNCKRANCGEQGSLKQLCEKLGIEWEVKQYESRKRTEKQYKKPNATLKPVTDSKITEYLKKRRLSQETIDLLQISEIDGKIAFPYYENGDLVAMKYRYKKDDETWKGFSMEPGGKLVFWAMDLCSPDMPLVITEGEFDCAVLWECGIQAVSLPNGCNSLDCVDLCWEWLQRFNTYYIWTDRDEGGIKARNELIKRLGTAKCLIVEHEKFKDANEVLYHQGKDGVVTCISNAQMIPLQGLKDLAELPEYNPENDIVTPSSIININSSLDGGYRMGEVSIWTGINSSGKSTLLGQELLSAIENGFHVCAYSGELPDRIFRYWVDLQAAGPEYVKQEEVRDRIISKVDPLVLPYIRNWYRGKFWLYDNQSIVTQDEILSVFEYAYRRHNCQVFMVDNLMSLALGSGSESNFYVKQADFVGQCKAFAQRFNVHIHIVVHPRKIKKGETVGKDDVGGSGNITNWSDNVLEVRRLSQKEIYTLDEKPEFKGLPIKSSLSILKNRFLGKQDITIFLGFEDTSKRFFAPRNDPKWRYGWVNAIGKKSTKDTLAAWEGLSK